MPGRPAWRITPRGRRSISQAASALGPHDIGRSRLALLVGAGVDQALAHRPGWNELLGRLGEDVTIAGLRNESLARSAIDWPMETAEALRLTLGPESFASALRRALPLRAVPELTSAHLAQAITRLIKNGANIIVSLNYTDDLVLALRDGLPNAFEVRVIDRAEISAWPIGTILSPARGEVHVLKLHGSLKLTDNLITPELILDRSSYDAVLAADSPYRTILSRLFEDFAVLSIGVSWTDVPLRDAAAQARKQLPVARAMHYATRQHSDDGNRDWWEERSLTASYGLRPLYYNDHAEAADILDSIARIAEYDAGPPANEDAGRIADWLDEVGDYESSQQSTWFAANWRAASETVKKACDPAVITRDNWLAAIRIERHLRHFIWFWLSSEERKVFREELWETIATGWDLLPRTQTSDLWQEERLSRALGWDRQEGEVAVGRALLDFAFGAYEIYGRNFSGSSHATDWINRLSQVRISAPDSLTGLRIGVASRVWTLEPSIDLVSMARDSCWEGMEAKLALDVSEQYIRAQAAGTPFETPRDWPGRVRDRLWGQMDHVRELSRVAGVNRREAAATVLASFLTPAAKAEADLIATYRRLKDFSSGQMEPGSAWSVLFGLTAVFVDQARDFSDQDLIGPLCEFLLDKCGDIPISEEILPAVQSNYARYWQSFHTRAANLAPRAASQLLR